MLNQVRLLLCVIYTKYTSSVQFLVLSKCVRQMCFASIFKYEPNIMEINCLSKNPGDRVLNIL